MHAPRLRSSGITPGFYPGITGPVKSVLKPRFSSIIPGFYPGFAIEYYFQGPARPKRLLSYSGLPFLVSFNAVTLQFANRFSLGAALQFARQLSLGVALQFANRLFVEFGNAPIR